MRLVKAMDGEAGDLVVICSRQEQDRLGCSW